MGRPSCFNPTAKVLEKQLPGGSRNTHTRTGGSEMQAGCDTGLRETGMKIFPCHLFPLVCYFLPPRAPCPQLLGPLSCFFPTLLTGKTGSRKGRGRRTRASRRQRQQQSRKVFNAPDQHVGDKLHGESLSGEGWDCGTLGFPQQAGSTLRHPGSRNGNAPGM